MLQRLHCALQLYLDASPSPAGSTTALLEMFDREQSDLTVIAT